MNAAPLLLLVLALTAGAGSVLSLRLAWRRKGTGNTLLVLAGWSALLVSMLLWTRLQGAEFGVSFALAWLVLCAAAPLLLNREFRPPQPDTPIALASAATSTGQKWLTFIGAGPAGLLATIPLTLMLTMLTPLSRVNQMAIAAVLFPTLWGLAAYGVSAGDNPGRDTVILIVVGALSTGVLFLMATSL